MFHVVHLATGRVLKSYNTAGWARREIDRLVALSNKADGQYYSGMKYWSYTNLMVMSAELYEQNKENIDPLVEVKNMMSGKPVMIRMSEIGTCVDPSTETYWSM